MRQTSMSNSILKFLAPPVFPDDEEKTRAAELLNVVLIAQTLLGVLSLAALLLGGTAPLQTYIAVVIFVILMVLLHIPMRQGFVTPVAYATVALFTAVLTFAIFSGGTIRAPGIILYTLTIIMSGLIISRQAAYWTAAINTVIFLGLLWLEINGRLPEPVTTVNVQQGIIFALNAIVASLLLGLALGRINDALVQARLGEEKLTTLNIELEQRVQERTVELEDRTQQMRRRADQLEAIANVARSSAAAQNLSNLLTAIAREVSLRFGFYHVGIFLLDENHEYALLIAANSQGGQRMLNRGHRLKVGEQGIVGFVTFRGQPRIALDVGEEAIFFNNPDLPDTHSEMALPLQFGQDILGALDIQSMEPNAFSREDLEIFSILADQVSVAIQNTRAVEQAQRALQEAEAASSQLTGQAWKEYLENARTRGYRYDGIKPEALKTAEVAADDKDTLFIPVQLRGQTIGRLKLKPSDQKRTWTDDERVIMEATAERMALALESARLLDEAQKRAARESFLSEVGTRLGGSFQLDSILRDTVEELGQTLKGSTVSFQLVNPSAPPTAKENSGSSNERDSR
jgi:GAF domain-containing protein